jgi:tRNA(adenine34) deaminase
MNTQMSAQDEYWMGKALALAQHAAAAGEVPVGAVLIFNDVLVGEGSNRAITTNDPTAHAEIVSLRQAAHHLQNYRLPDTTLYVTLEPCAMCVGALVHARIKRLVFGALEPKAGAVCSRFHLLQQKGFNHQLEFHQGILESECSQILSDFFQQRREQKKLS